MSGWTPPTGPGLTRWHRLHRDAVNLLAKPMNGGGELSRSVLAVTSDSFPTRDPDHWTIYGQWLKAARHYAHATPLERQTDAAVFADLTRWAGLAMGLTADQIVNAVSGPIGGSMAASSAVALPFRRDIDG